MPNLDAEFPREEKIYYYRQAGKIAFEVHEEIKAMVKPGALVIEICEKAQALILEKGGKAGFPCNISINNVAAHYTSPADDETLIPEGSVVKVDLGVHINGFISDKAETYCFNEEYKSLVEASQTAWKNAMELVRVGIETNMLGVAVEDTIRDFNYLPIRELSGHLLDRYQLHGNKTLPNVRLPFGKADSVMEVDEVYAFETFATSGSGSVHEDQNKTYIYMIRPTNRVALRSQASRDIRNFMFKEYFTLPFAERWVTNQPNFHPARVRLTLRELRKVNGVHPYPVLVDNKDSFISQYENTFMVTNQGYSLTTMPPFDFEKPESIKQKEEELEEAVKSLKEGKKENETEDKKEQ